MSRSPPCPLSAAERVFSVKDLFLLIGSFTQFVDGPVESSIVYGGFKLAHLNKGTRQDSGEMCKKLYEVSQRRLPHGMVLTVGTPEGSSFSFRQLQDIEENFFNEGKRDAVLSQVKRFRRIRMLNTRPFKRGPVNCPAAKYRISSNRALIATMNDLSYVMNVQWFTNGPKSKCPFPTSDSLRVT